MTPKSPTAMNEITIELNKQEFSSGDTVAGEVILRLEKETKLRGIRLTLEGYEKVIWISSGKGGTHTRSEKHRIFDHQVTLEQPGPGQPEPVVESANGIFSKASGTYRYPFTCVLPPHLPGSYESALTFCEVQIYYGVKATADLPPKSALEAEQPLVVREPAVPVPVATVPYALTRTFGADSDSQVEAVLYLDKDSFYPGELLHSRIEVMNRASRKEIRGVTLDLWQLETVSTWTATREKRDRVAKVRVEERPFPPGQRTAVDVEMAIPADLHPTVERASWLKLEYQLMFTLDLPWASDVELPWPVTVVRAPEQVPAEQ